LAAGRREAPPKACEIPSNADAVGKNSY